MATVWVYNWGGEYLIVKRTPFAYQMTTMDASGHHHLEILQGVGIPLPKWDWVQKHTGYVLAGFFGKIYEISDLT